MKEKKNENTNKLLCGLKREGEKRNGGNGERC